MNKSLSMKNMSEKSWHWHQFLEATSTLLSSPFPRDSTRCTIGSPPSKPSCSFITVDVEVEETECDGHGGIEVLVEEGFTHTAKVLVFENWILLFLCSFIVGFQIATSLLFISLTCLIFVYFFFSFLFYFGFKILYCFVGGFW